MREKRDMMELIHSMRRDDMREHGITQDELSALYRVGGYRGLQYAFQFGFMVGASAARAEKKGGKTHDIRAAIRGRE